MKEVFGAIARGGRPVLVVAPHTGTSVPEDLLPNPVWAEINGRLSDPAGASWVSIAGTCDITAISATIHPCVIDLNVATDNRSLSARLNRVGLCRTHTSRGESLYMPGQDPDDMVVSRRIATYWEPFHNLVTQEIARLKERHEHIAVLISHASSWLSPYREQVGGSELNLGTGHGHACDRKLAMALADGAKENGRSWVVNGRLGGIFSALHYGAPERGIHAVEIEIAGKWRSELEQGANQLGDVSARAMSSLLDHAEAVVLGLPAIADVQNAVITSDKCNN
jgi:N-formylglutamate deformylase